MDFEARVRIVRKNPEMRNTISLMFEAADWDEAHETAPTLSLPHGYSAYRLDSVVALERLV